MKLTHYTQKDFKVSTWSGGTTTQFGICPKDAVYADRDFLWRLSSATCNLAESDFTSLPDYHRIISTLEGTITLTHNGGDPIVLHPFEIHEFEGGDSTHCIGTCRDYNLMLRRGKCGGSAQGMALPQGEHCYIPGEKSKTVILFLAEGSFRVRHGDEMFTLNAMEALQAEEPEAFTLECETDCRLIAAEIW